MAIPKAHPCAPSRSAGVHFHGKPFHIKENVLIKWLRRLFITAIILVLLITNVLSLTSTVFNATLTGLMATAMGVKTVTSKLHAQVANQKSAVRNMGRNLTARTKRIAAYSVAEIPASVVPYAGMAILVTGTAWELKQLCDGLYELEELYTEIELEEEVDSDLLKKVCHPSGWHGDSEQQ